MGAPDSEFETQKAFSVYVFFAGCTSQRYKNRDFRHCLKIAEKPKTVDFFLRGAKPKITL